MSSTPRDYRKLCVQSTCPHYRAVMNFKTKNTMTFDEVDWVHMYDQHLRAWGEYGWAKLEKEQAENEKLRGELNKMKTNRAVPRALSSCALNTDPILIVDPKNHVDGICDALVANGTAIYKCTDLSRHGKNVCAIHLNHKNLIKHEK